LVFPVVVALRGWDEFPPTPVSAVGPPPTVQSSMILGGLTSPVAALGAPSGGLTSPVVAVGAPSGGKGTQPGREPAMPVVSDGDPLDGPGGFPGIPLLEALTCAVGSDALAASKAAATRIRARARRIAYSSALAVGLRMIEVKRVRFSLGSGTGTDRR
jgi:hypothetical protein